MTDKDEKTKVSYSAISGELRKSARLYEVFKHASEAADILANFEREEKAASIRISILNKELKSLDDKCDESYLKQQKAEKEAKDALEEKLDILNKARIDAEGIKSRATNQVDKILSEARNELNNIQSDIEKAKDDAHKANVAKESALKSLSKVEKQMKEAKDKFLNTLG